jgi:hypothetical protein
MNKPETLKDLMIGGYVGRNEIEAIARALFNDETTMAGPEGYVITGVNYDALPPHVQGFIIKAILEFKVENVLDANADTDKEIDDDDEPMEDGNQD